MRLALMKFYWKLEKIFHPKLRYSQQHYYETLSSAVRPSCDWLDLGCGHQMFASWMMGEEAELARRSRRLIGIDLDWESLRNNPSLSGRVYGRGETLPFAASTFDLVTANMVVEHLDDPAAVLRQVHRVLRPGGKFIFHTPNVQAVMISIASTMPQALKNKLALILENRKEEDVFPTHYKMNRFSAIHGAARAGGFRVLELRSVSTSAITQMLGPIAIVELLYLKLLELPALERFRSNLIVTLQKDDPAGTAGHAIVRE